MKVIDFDKSMFFWGGRYRSQIGVGIKMGKERESMTRDNLFKHFAIKENKERIW